MTSKVKINREKLLQLYNEGYTPDQMASIFGTKSGKNIEAILRKELKKPVTNGKIKSLWLAGWGIERIMKECNVTQEEVREVICGIED